MPAVIINTKLGENKGQSRVYLEGARLGCGGFEVGARYEVVISNKKVTMKVSDGGTYTVSRRTRNGNLSPIIDLSNQRLTDAFQGVAMLRVLIRNGSIVVTAHHQQGKEDRREERLFEKLSTGAPLSVASLFAGGGVLDKAIHAGLAKSGIASAIAVAIEIEGKYVDSSLQNNPELWNKDSIVINAPIETINYSLAPAEVDLLVAGLPCTGASRAGKSSNKLEFAEDHDAAGAMFFNFLQLVQNMNPALILVENVVEYAKTASMSVIRSVLQSLGYTLSERVLAGNEFGALENRKRLCMVAVSNGLGAFDLDTVMPVRKKEETISEILDDVADDSPRWKAFDYLVAKEIRDIEAGKGFKRQMLDGQSTSCPVIARGYAKCRSSEPYLKHPSDESLSRIFTPAEHARIKGIPACVVDGLSDTIAHQILGQSVIFPAFAAVGVYLGRMLKSLATPFTMAQAA